MPSFRSCPECFTLATALQGAWHADNQALRIKLRDVAANSGRDFQQFGFQWVMSVTEMPDEEMRVLLESHYPTVAEAKRRCEEHEKATGHSLRGWYMRSSYFGNQPE